MLDTAKIARVSILAQRENGHGSVYSTTRTSQKPRKVIDAIVHYYSFHNATCTAARTRSRSPQPTLRGARPGRPVRECLGSGKRRLHGEHRIHQLVAGSWAGQCERGDTVVVTAWTTTRNRAMADPVSGKGAALRW